MAHTAHFPAANEREDAGASQVPHDVAEFERELGCFHAAPYGVILDAGCGAGDVTRHLAQRFPTNLVIGVDACESVVALAKAGGRLPNISFNVCNPLRLKLDDASIDQIVCRFAMQAMPPEIRTAVLLEFFRVLKPRGQIALVDVDGIAETLHPATPLLTETVREMRQGRLADLPAGRRLPRMLAAAGFDDIDSHTQEVSATRANASQHLARLAFDADTFDDLFGSPGAAQSFRQDLAACLALPRAELHYTKRIVTAAKPGQ